MRRSYPKLRSGAMEAHGGTLKHKGGYQKIKEVEIGERGHPMGS